MLNQLDEIATGLLDQVVAEGINPLQYEGRSFCRFVYEEGILLPGMALPDAYPRRSWRECFRNAALDALSFSELIYCEGFAARPDFSVITHHAWTVTKAGQVIDTTWDIPEYSVYMGVPISREYLWRWHSNYAKKDEVFGTPLYDYDARFPIITGRIAYSKWFALHQIRKDIRDVSQAYCKGYADQSLRKNKIA